jgi:hypothetical protein
LNFNATGNVLVYNGTNGSNGVNGLNGLNGRDGTNGINGLNGINGKDGTNGNQGAPGVAGQVVYVDPPLMTGLKSLLHSYNYDCPYCFHGRNACNFSQK